MFSWHSLFRALQQNRCAIKQALLSDGEFVVSREACPSLYSKINGSEKDIVRQVVKSILANVGEFFGWMAIDRSNQLRMQRFFGLCLSHLDAGDEFFVHAYVYIFWADLQKDLILSKRLASSPKWVSSEFGIENAQLSASEELIFRQLKKATAEIDLFTYNPADHCLSLIEIKRGPCDDRAVGQALRYYRQALSLIESRDFRKIPVHYVDYILIASDFPEAVVRSFPIHFLANIELIRYRTADFGIPVFSSARSELKFIG